MGITETDQVGQEAAEQVPDPGPADPKQYLAAQIDEDDHAVDGILDQVRKISDLRWEHSAPVRVGCRMGRPEKAAPRIMNPMTHALFPIDLTGGNQRLMSIAAEKQTIRVQMGRRVCNKCGKESPFVVCHHRLLDEHGQERVGETCGGRTVMKSSENSNRRRRGEIQSVRLDTILEDARIRLGMDRIPRTVKCMKKIASRDQTPEAIEKGLLYAYTGRKQKKRNFRSLWITRINAGAREHGMSYSQFMGGVKKNGIELNRKVLADLAMNHPEAFKAVVDSIKK